MVVGRQTDGNNLTLVVDTIFVLFSRLVDRQNAMRLQVALVSFVQVYNESYLTSYSFCSFQCCWCYVVNICGTCITF